ncbi:SDR family NAD(P)-dependent oxidoreductase [Chryseobacterium oncorhynchi]|uniref:SDR family oxidoreductase n=1 Tax=Chryseobacterium oncorhynchi TaxID=741074 RepID=A0A316X0F3_9FLAO|nr:SDR family NAD(P)-dependent oxidoreductase [Chryseobacterium oncorhynchi]PWN67352.1 SDR family oxidoreductase [Chryseobacterium oncorhynchi]
MNKTIMIIGAGQGVGLETARYFGLNGYQIGLMSRNQKKLDSLKAELEAEGISVINEIIDANIPESVSSSVKKLAEKLGNRLDIVLYNVPGPLGAESYVPVVDLSFDLLSTYLNTRVLSALEVAKTTIPYLSQTNGSILFTSGQSDRFAYPFTSAMGVSQAALRMLTTHLHNELTEKGIFVGYVPIDNPPLYSNSEKENTRSDLPSGFELENRTEATNVAKKLFNLSMKRDNLETRVEPTSH